LTKRFFQAKFRVFFDKNINQKGEITMPTTLAIRKKLGLEITTLQTGDIIGYATQRSQRCLKILRPGNPDIRLLFLESDHGSQISSPAYRAAWITDKYIFEEVASLMAASARKRAVHLTESNLAKTRNKLDVIWAMEII